ncbi:MAG: hypothetical protein LBL41_06025 [Bifidobacteriaceae bacterium]|nr:hypothetical protein [Bifidobacteriaceae bacterium]
MESKTVFVMRKYALPAINIMCVIVQMGVSMQFGMLVSGYYEADGSYTLMQWDEFMFPASDHLDTWMPSLLYAVVALILVCTVNNKRLHIIVTVISAIMTAFQVVCLMYAV